MREVRMRRMDELPGQVVVCATAELPSFFTDSLTGACALCGAAVRCRPHAPTPRSLVCLLCFMVHAEPGDECYVTTDTIAELAALGPDVPKC